MTSRDRVRNRVSTDYSLESACESKAKNKRLEEKIQKQKTEIEWLEQKEQVLMDTVDDLNRKLESRCVYCQNTATSFNVLKKFRMCPVNSTEKFQPKVCDELERKLFVLEKQYEAVKKKDQQQMLQLADQAEKCKNWKKKLFQSEHTIKHLQSEVDRLEIALKENNREKKQLQSKLAEYGKFHFIEEPQKFENNIVVYELDATDLDSGFLNDTIDLLTPLSDVVGSQESFQFSSQSF